MSVHELCPQKSGHAAVNYLPNRDIGRAMASALKKKNVAGSVLNQNACRHDRFGSKIKRPDPTIIAMVLHVYV